MLEEVEVYIERVEPKTITFGGRSSGTNLVRQVTLSREAWVQLGTPEGLKIQVRRR